MFKYTISLFALAISTNAFAEETVDEVETRPNDEIIVTASRSGEGVRADQLGASVTVLGNDALQERQTRIVSDILRDVPGVAVNRTGAVGGFTQVRLRGTENNHTLVLVDGIEVADPYYGEYDFGTMIADPAARIEILRGQQSSLYGSDAIGGVINYVTLSGRDQPGMSARIEGGSLGTLGGSARLAGTSDDFDYAVSGSYIGTNGYPTARGGTRKIGSKNVGATAKVHWNPSENFQLSGVVRYSYTDADMNNSEYNITSPLFGYIVDSPGVRFNNEAFYGLLSARFTALDGRWITTVSGQFADTTRKAYNAFGFDYGNKGKRYKGSLTSSFNFGSDAIKHRLTGAVDIERESFRNLSSFSFNGERHTDNIGIVGQYELIAGDLSLGASLRHDKNNRFDDPTTWRVQGSYQLPTKTRIRGAYGTGVKNPGYYELYGYMDGRYIGNPSLKPEKSQGWEIGVEQNFGQNNWATLGVTYFDAELKDEIYASYPPPTFISTPANRETKSKQRGVEAFASARPIPQIRFDLAYTWTKSLENGVPETRRPRHIGSLNTTIFSADQRFSTTLTMRYNGRMTDLAYTDASYVGVPVTMKEFVLVNIGADYRVSENVSLFGRVENLLNEEYEEVFSYATAGRTAYGGVSVKF